MQGDIYRGEEDDIYWQTLQSGTTDVSGGNLLARWERDMEARGVLTLQAYYDYYERDTPVLSITPMLSITTETLDFDLQHRIPLGERHELAWGFGYRRIDSEIPQTPTTRFSPEQRSDNLFSAFIQDEYKLIPDKVRLILGSKFEHNDYSGFEYQPNARLLWTPDDKRSLWAAVSRAVRTPSRMEHTMSIEALIGSVSLPPPSPPLEVPLLLRMLGNEELDSEKVLAYEIGFRHQTTPKLFLDLAVFYNKYEDLVVGDRSLYPEGTMPPDVRMIVENMAQNNLAGHTYGLEAVGDWIARDWMHLKLAYTYLGINLDKGNQTSAYNIENRSPKHQISLRALFDVNEDWDVDIWLRHVDELADPQPSEPLNSGVNAYTTLDLRIAWKITKQLSLSLVGTNLLDERHAEFPAEPLNPLSGEVERSFYGQLRWKF